MDFEKYLTWMSLTRDWTGQGRHDMSSAELSSLCHLIIKWTWAVKWKKIPLPMENPSTDRSKILSTIVKIVNKMKLIELHSKWFPFRNRVKQQSLSAALWARTYNLTGISICIWESCEILNRNYINYLKTIKRYKQNFSNYHHFQLFSQMCLWTNSMMHTPSNIETAL